MTDIVDAATRSRMMASIPSRDTKPELMLRAALRRHGLGGYRCHVKSVPGRPDIAYIGHKIAVFVDGAFWHGHPDYFKFGKSGPKWDAKIRRNIQRDREVERLLYVAGWRSIRIWDFEIRDDPDAVVDRISPLIRCRAQATAAGRSSTTSPGAAAA